jgi:hypothetical protein
MTMGYLPSRLPTSCLSMAPRFDIKHNASLVARRNPLSEVNSQNQNPNEVRPTVMKNILPMVRDKCKRLISVRKRVRAGAYPGFCRGGDAHFKLTYSPPPPPPPPPPPRYFSNVAFPWSSQRVGGGCTG